MTTIDYLRNLERLRRQKSPEEAASPSVVYRTVPDREGYDASVVDKITRWFGEGSHYFLVKPYWTKSKGVWEIVIPFDVSKINLVLGDPGEKRLKCVFSPSWDKKLSPEENLRQRGLLVSPSPKLHKRLGRLFGTMHIGALENPRVRIWRGEKAGPVSVTDGFAFISGEAYTKATGKKCPNFHAVQFSYVGPAGMLKGTAVVVHNLPFDISVSKHNLKSEVRTTGKSVLYVEQDYYAKPARTDVQTIVHNNWYELFGERVDEKLDELELLAGSWDILNDWLHHDYDEWSWWQRACQEAKAKGKEMPEKPILEAAREAGIHTHTSPWLRIKAWREACRLVDIKGMKVPYDHKESIRGYIVPDLTLFNHDGSYKGPDSRSLGKRQLGCSKVPSGLYLAYRQPNAMKEIVEAENVQPYYPSGSLIQVNLHNMIEKSEDWLKSWGGADHDDSIVMVSDETALRQHVRNLQEWEHTEIPNLEAIIDASVQAGSGDLSPRAQVEAAMTPPVLPLGVAVNFLMNLRLCEEWEWYDLAAKSETVAEMAEVYEEYHKQEKPKYADIFAYEDRQTRARGCRVPIEDFENFCYQEVNIIETSVGRKVKEASKRMQDLWEVQADTRLLSKGCWIRSKSALDWIESKTTDPAKEVAEVLYDLWKAAQGRNHTIPLGAEDVFEEAREMIGLDLHTKMANWNTWAEQALAANPEIARQIVAYVGYLEMSPSSRKTASGKYKHRKGIDMLVWSPACQDLWVEVLKLYQEWKGVKAT